MSAGIGLDGHNLKEMDFLVDTGSFYTFLPPEPAAELGISLPVRSEVVLADSRRATVPLVVATSGFWTVRAAFSWAPWMCRCPSWVPAPWKRWASKLTQCERFWSIQGPSGRRCCDTLLAEVRR